jgi:hypothetical protein
MRFRRKPHDVQDTRAESEIPPPADDPKPSITGTYLTDGRSLFRVQHAITEAEGLHLDEPLLELEDCATLELILCSAGALERLGLRPVSPSGDGEPGHSPQPALDLIERLTRSH